MKISRVLFLTIFFLLCHYTNNHYVLAKEVVSVSSNQVIEVLQKSNILTVSQRNILSKFIRNLKSSDWERAQLEIITSEIVKKVKRDRKNLKNLLYFLEELSENKYARRIGRISKSDLKALQHKMEEYENQTGELYFKGQLNQDEVNKEKYIKIIRKTSKSLIKVNDSSNVESFAVWYSIYAKTKKVYKQWNEASVRLRQNKIGDSSEGGISLDIDEDHFLKDFSKAQVLFRRLSPPNSSDF